MSKLFKLLGTVAVLMVIAAPASAYEAGDWIVRGGVGVVDPQGTAYTDPTDPDFVVKVDSGTSLTLTGTYMFTPNWAFDILAAWPFTHDIVLEGVAKIGETEQLPPTFSIQYHFAPDAKFQPYVGVGLNWTTFFNTELEPVLAGFTLDLDDSFGVAVELGGDLQLANNWVLQFDLRWISIESDATLSDGVDSESFTVDINPLVYALNVGYKFN